MDLIKKYVKDLSRIRDEGSLISYLGLELRREQSANIINIFIKSQFCDTVVVSKIIGNHFISRIFMSGIKSKFTLGDMVNDYNDYTTQFIPYDEKVEYIFKPVNETIEAIVCRTGEEALNVKENNKNLILFDNICFIFNQK